MVDTCTLSLLMQAAIVGDARFQGVPELVKAMEQIDAEKFPKLMAYLKNPMSRRVRTNNHVERTNRMFRLLEKVRYKWRQRRMLADPRTPARKGNEGAALGSAVDDRLAPPRALRRKPGGPNVNSRKPCSTKSTRCLLLRMLNRC